MRDLLKLLFWIGFIVLMVWLGALFVEWVWNSDMPTWLKYFLLK